MVQQTIRNGIYPTMITPYTEDDRLDEQAIRKLVRWYGRNDCHGIFTACQSSEVFCLSLKERRRMTELVKGVALEEAEKNRKSPMTVVSSGHISETPEEQAEELIMMHEAGADAVVLISNRLDIANTGTAAWIWDLDRLLQRLPSHIRLGIYECPTPYKRLLDEDMLREIMDTGRFFFFKDTCCDPVLLQKRAELLKNSSVKLLNANAQTLLASLQYGGCGYCGWNYKPYLPANRYSERKNPYICRLAPGEDCCELEWLGEGTQFLLEWMPADRQEETESFNVQSKETIHSFRIQGLRKDEEYMLRVTDKEGRQSRIRLFRTGKPVGTVVNYLHPQDDCYGFSGQYLASPSIIKLPGGTLLASMDVFGFEKPQNLTLLFRSDDGGESWHYVTDIFPCFWGKLFWHQDKLFMLGISQEYGDILIGCSEDLGESWSAPAVILRGSASTREDGPHRAPVPVLHSHRRLWTGIEYGSWQNSHFYDSLLSIDEQADPMITENWTLTDFVYPVLPGNDRLAGTPGGGIEGNAVELPDGRVVDLLRYDKNRALMLQADPKDPDAVLKPAGIVELPVAHAKFDILKHANGRYYVCGNPYPGRNVLALYSSPDAEHWTRTADIVDHREFDKDEVGFQYPSVCADGEKLLILSRTAWNHPHNFHDSNYITFHQVFLQEEKMNPPEAK